MNKFLTYAGSQPVYLGDIDFMQNAAKEVFTGIARALMDSASVSMNAILQGVVLSYRPGDQLHYSSGIVVIDGEILPVYAATISAGRSANLYFHVESTLSGSRTMKNGETKQCYETRSAYISTESTGGLLVSSVHRLHEEVTDNAAYEYSSKSSYIDSGILYRKNGFFSIFVAFRYSPPEGEESADLGSVSFADLSSEHYSSFPQISFPCWTVYGDDIVPLICTTTKSNNTVTCSFKFANESQQNGISGYIRQLVPVTNLA